MKVDKSTKVKIHVSSEQGKQYSLEIDFNDFNKRMGNAFQYNYPVFKFTKIEFINKNQRGE